MEVGGKGGGVYGNALDRLSFRGDGLYILMIISHSNRHKQTKTRAVAMKNVESPSTLAYVRSTRIDRDY